MSSLPKSEVSEAAPAAVSSMGATAVRAGRVSAMRGPAGPIRPAAVLMIPGASTVGPGPITGAVAMSHMPAARNRR